MNTPYAVSFLLVFLLPFFAEAAQSGEQSHIELVFPAPRSSSTNATGVPTSDRTTAPCGDFNIVNEAARTKFPISGAPIAIDTYGNFSSPSPDSFSVEIRIGQFNATTATQRDVWYQLPLGQEWQLTGSNADLLWCSFNVSANHGSIMTAAKDDLQMQLSDADLNGLTATFQWILRAQFANRAVKTQYTVRIFC
jgi:hypothetical protein